MIVRKYAMEELSILRVPCSLFRKVLAYYGASYDDIAAWGGKVEYLNIGDASTLFTDGQLNAVSLMPKSNGTPSV